MTIDKKQHMLVWIMIMALVAAGCGSSRSSLKRSSLKHVLRLTPDTLQNRVLQTRKFEGISEADLLSASAGVIQDLGFIIDESETNLGLIVGSKKRDATNETQLLWLALFVPLAIMLGEADQIKDMSLEDYQKLWASVVIRPTTEDEDKTHLVRVTFQRIVWNDNDEISRMESLDEPEMYQRFFDLLSTSVFLEGQKI